ncbi:EB module [Ostertagia ostertagi]
MENAAVLPVAKIRFSSTDNAIRWRLLVVHVCSTSKCTGYSQCTNGYCTCPNGAPATNGMCNIQNNGCKSYQVRNPSEYCNINIFPEIFVTFITSNKFHCAVIQVAVNNQCLDKVSIGQSCTNNAQCIVNAICSTTCQCSYPYSYNGTACVTGVSYCSQGMVSIAGQCLRLVPLGQSCQLLGSVHGIRLLYVVDMSVPWFVYSRERRCADAISESSSNCNYDQVLIGNQCYPLVKIGAQCIYSQQCSGGSSCLSNVCRCPSGTFDNGDGYCRSGDYPGTQMCRSPTEEVVYEPNSVTPINCRFSSCPSNSYCYANPQMQQSFCCRSRQSGGGSGKCKNPSESIIYENGKAINCLYSQCPSNSHCEHSSSEQQYVCCR